MIRRMIRGLLVILLAGIAAAPLAACGKRGPPDPPPGEPNTYPRSYPVDRG
jgi:predicted small lipoprotein YifL